MEAVANDDPALLEAIRGLEISKYTKDSLARRPSPLLPEGLPVGFFRDQNLWLVFIISPSTPLTLGMKLRGTSRDASVHPKTSG